MNYFNCVLLVTVGLCATSTADEDETNPFLDAAKALLQDSFQQGNKDGFGGGLGTLFQNFMQGEGGRQIGDVLQQSGGGDLLSGLGSLLTGRQQGESGLDPQLLAKVVELFSGSSEKTNQGGAMEGLFNLLPLLANTGHKHHDDPALENAEEHRQHVQATSSIFPPFLWNLWDHFSTSELGQTLMTNSGLGETLQLFQDKEGNFQMDRIFQSLENYSFRKRWVRAISSFAAEWIKFIADPATQKRYVTAAQFIGNGFLKAQGYSKAVLFDPSRPAESLSLMVNAVFKRNFGLKINSITYIKPAVAYIQELLHLTQRKGLSISFLSSKDIENKLSETVNSEVIEPILRVWRAYKFTLKEPQCDRYLICSITHPEQGENREHELAGIKPSVTKLASLVASWFLSGNTGTPFWKLYNAVVEDHNCQIKYPADCSQFHEEDLKATTEYLHNEL